MEEYKIEKGIPMKRLGPVQYYPFDEMEVGDSFFVPFDESETRLLQARVVGRIQSYRKNNNGRRFATRKIEEERGFRVWRTK